MPRLKVDKPIITKKDLLELLADYEDDYELVFYDSENFDGLANRELKIAFGDVSYSSKRIRMDLETKNKVE